MATYPTQMRLTELDKARIDRIKKIERQHGRTNTLRYLVEYYEKMESLPPIQKIPKKSSVAT